MLEAKDPSDKEQVIEHEASEEGFQDYEAEELSLDDCKLGELFVFSDMGLNDEGIENQWVGRLEVINEDSTFQVRACSRVDGQPINEEDAPEDGVCFSALLCRWRPQA